ncbi:GTPase Era [Hyphococcus luteus]|uniref:GTPase Era n=1 Tax=Hyphococcus luteus TaxID=2058213 RepID=A0A2S7K1R3_9PROT|nr:GTPase Era [Marinicaulis flavus]PQA86442.1 GTPase Era [Marinicaulis flavus]
MSDENTKCAVVAVIGAPNAGKSTLVNALVGAKISIVTQKVQTTRARVRGILTDGATQLVFIDTPGIFAPKRKLDRAMVAAAWEGLEGSDITLMMIDAPGYLAGETEKGAAGKSRADAERIIEGLKAANRKAALVLNKIDDIARPKLLALAQDLNEAGIFTDVFMISAKNGDGLGDLRTFLLEKAPAGPWLYPEDQLSDISDRLMAAEVTREKLFLRLHQELPYDSTVETDSWKETKSGVRVDQTIYVARDSQKPIVLGKNGQTLKAIGQAAREELTDILGIPVHLFLHVKVREGWDEEGARLRSIGLDSVE